MAKKKKVVKTSKPSKPAKKKATKRVLRHTTNKYAQEERVNKKAVDLKKAAKKIEAEPSATTLQSENVLTLLNVPSRKKLPSPPEEMTKLYGIVTDTPNDYQYFIALLRDGASLSSACAGAGICSFQELMTMLKRGAQDINRNSDVIEDTYYSRLYIDVTRTIAITTAEVESLVKSEDPKFWLRNGPGRLFGESWRDDPAKEKHITHSHGGNITMDHILSNVSDEKEEELNPDELIIDQNSMDGALEEFAQAGLITLQPDYHVAKRIQAGELLSDDEMEDMEDAVSTGSDGVLELNSEGMPVQKCLPNPEKE